MSRAVGLIRLTMSALTLLAAAVLPQAHLAQAVINPSETPTPAAPQPRLAAPAAALPAYDLKVSGTGPGQSVTGAIDKSRTFDPTTQDYPTSVPTGFTALNEWAGVINGQPPSGSPTVTLYCIDIQTPTSVGVQYDLGNWDAASVSRIGYVTRILSEYYPNTGEPSNLTANQRAAAVQAAIWYFSDRYVLQPTDPLHNAVAAIVNNVRAEGPIGAPQPPTLTITPTSLSGPAGSLVGPFTVNSTTSQVAVTATGGAQMFSDAAGTTPIANNTSVSAGAQVWLKLANAGTAGIQAVAQATVPFGNVYLHVGAPTANQRLILSKTATLSSTVSASAQFLPAGSLLVNKIITGPGAQLQSNITIQVVCNDVLQQPVFTIPAGTAAGTRSQTYMNIPLGATCVVTETANGSNNSVTVTVTGSPTTVNIPSSGGGVTVNVSDQIDLVPTPTPTATVTPTATDTPITTPTTTATPTSTSPVAASCPTASPTPTLPLTATARVVPTSTSVSPAPSVTTVTPVPTSTTLAGAPTSTPAPTSTSAATSRPITGGGGGAPSQPAGASTPTWTPTPTPSSTSVPPATSTPTSPAEASTAVSPVPTDTPNEQIVRGIAIYRLQQLTTMTPGGAPAQVPSPPVQIPGADDANGQWAAPGSFDDGALGFVQALFAGSSASLQTAQTIDPCGPPPEIQVSGSVDKSSVAVGDDVTYTLTVSDPGPVDLSAFTFEVSLPANSVILHTATAGTISPQTGYFEVLEPTGLAAGTSRTFIGTATVLVPGTLEADICVAGRDALGRQATDCASQTVMATSPAGLTATPTPTSIVSATSTPTTVSATPTPTAAPATATPTATVRPTPSPTPVPPRTSTPTATTAPTNAPTSTPVPTATAKSP